MPRARRHRNPVADPMPAETMFPLSELDRMLPLSDTALHTAAGSKRGRRSSRPSVSSRGTRTILKEPETRRLKNRNHLARNRKFESISLQQRVHCELDLRGRSRPAQRHDRRSVPHRLEVVRQASCGFGRQVERGSLYNAEPTRIIGNEGSIRAGKGGSLTATGSISGRATAALFRHRPRFRDNVLTMARRIPARFHADPKRYRKR